ncbi:MAG: beta-N-acetylhexosaminidase [Clostridia bacterium]|nr:beta-N-acetylhexosaminidase [Clostridia bacterium]
MKKFKFESMGVMVDVSRNNVMSLEGWRRYMPILAKMGYNTVFLYAEDTYTVEGEPYFGYMRGRYTTEEMKALDELAASYGIEMIPCIQTLGHLAMVSKWGVYPTDNPDILLVGDERTYELIDNMFKSLRACFKTNRLHVGMDEAWSLGRGKYLDKNGYDTQGNIMKKHLARVTEIAAKYGYELMIWSDMFFRGWNGGKYYAPKTEIPKEYRDAVPESVIPVYWDYYTRDEQRFSDMLDNHKQLSKNVWFAGGAWTWAGFIPSNKFSLETMLPAIEACKKQGVKNFFVTMWGDNGGECSKLAVLPTLFYLAEAMRGNTDEEKIKAKFQRTFGISFDDFMLIDEPNLIFPDADPVIHPRNPSKYMLYSDYLCGFLDFSVGEGGNALYADMAEKLSAVAKKTRRFGYIFDTAAKLCDVLKYKYELGVKTRAAYKAGDKEELRRLANEDYTEVAKALPKLLSAFEKQWCLENKYVGFEVQQCRLGTMITRTAAVKKRILDYVNGKLPELPELDVEILPFEGREFGKSMYYNNFSRTFTSNTM